MADIKLTKNRRKTKETTHTDDVATGFATMPTNGVRHQPVSVRHETTSSGPRVDGTHAVRTIDDDERRRMIAEAAYYRAQRRGFTNGSPESDWLEAEAEVIALLAHAGMRA